MLTIFRLLKRFIYRAFNYICFIVALILLRVFIIQPVIVQGDSMFPTFHNNDFVLSSPIVYKLKEPKPGDVVIFDAPEKPGTVYIKRVIATEGETVKIENDHYYVNNELLNEPYINQNTEPLIETTEWTVAPDTLFVSGDNRRNSYDSRKFGPIKKDTIKGKIVFRIWPLFSAKAF